MDIYSRVRELVEDKKEKLTMEQIFTSSEYARFIWNKTVNIAFTEIMMEPLFRFWKRLSKSLMMWDFSALPLSASKA